MEPEYSNREIDTKMHEITQALERIEKQTTKTNGRVTALEKWMWMVVGGLTLLSFLMGSQLINING